MKILIKKVINGWILQYNKEPERVFTNPEDVIRCAARIVGAAGCVRCDCRPEENDLKWPDGEEFDYTP